MGLVAGTYRAAIIDVNGCSDTTSVVISQPSDWNHIVDSVNASCYAYCDGLITVTPSGGTGPYSHSWNIGESNSSIINLCASTYIDTITDSRGCMDTISVIIREPDSLEAQPLIINHVLCNGDSTARIISSGLGGTAPYSYDWGGGQTTANGDTVFNIVGRRLRKHFSIACKKARIHDFRFHDLRACFCTNALLSGMTIPQVAAISGHKDWSQLKRYTRIKATDLTDHVNKISSIREFKKINK